MSVAKFVAANGREAMRQVREAMGPDAVVLSNRTVEGGVEIVAMRDADLGSVSASAQAYVPPAPAMVVAETPAIGDLRGELQSMRALLERQLAGIGNAPTAAGHGVAASDPLRESLFEWMVGAGFSGQLARTLLARLPLGYDRPAAMTWIRKELASKVPVLGDEDHLFAQGGVLALIGPTGVGKTTTTAKLAARFVLRHGADKLALLTTDSFRIGAHEQLRIYGDILGVPVHAVKDAADLRFALAAMKDKHLVIIDTVGMSQRDRSLSEQIAMLAGVPAPVQRVLLLNGASHGDTLNEVVHAYRHDAAPDGGGIDGCIISKLDEATHLGSVLDVVIRHRLPVFYASTGQRVPEHLELASSTALVERAFLTPRRGSVFADADAARRRQAVADEQAAKGGADDVLRSLTDSADALGQCAAELNNAGLGFDLARTLWQQRTAGDTALRAMAQQVREAVCRDVNRACDQYVLALAATLPVSVPGRRTPQPLQHTLWLGDRDGTPLAATITAAGRAGQPLGEADAEAANLRAAMSAARKVVNLIDAMPSAATLARWQQAGERWLAGARKAVRVVSAGAAWKLDALADTLTFHAVGDAVVRERDAVRWLATADVRVPDSPARGKGAPEGGIDACLAVVRLVDRASGELLDTRYLLCDPALAPDAAQVARWAPWSDTAETRLRTLRHAADHFAQDADAGHAGHAASAALAALQLGLSVLRLEHAPTATAPSFLARLAGRTVRAGAAVPGTVLNEGMGRMLALLDVLENYPGRAAAAPAVAEAADVMGALQ
ncbi:flagellar biosynthesis protein FlhF [Cupriavidus oxalaticus]|uniref:Flagellar biosynthesis protein FlhF n=1 Tax=Cupriavidus oxalaticus TaxID=96344 RepID=A0A5P3VD37_9BURK|nr:flagellar biosynthesis protein FlhF [Cupriavidus oxalaticus]QEZ44314.1 flagellar biosynthesis protein FlhF [Cupriavidus oxalaticus]